MSEQSNTATDQHSAIHTFLENNLHPARGSRSAYLVDGFKAGWEAALRSIQLPITSEIVAENKRLREMLTNLISAVESYADSGLIENYNSDTNMSLSDWVDDTKEALALKVNRD